MRWQTKVLLGGAILSVASVWMWTPSAQVVPPVTHEEQHRSKTEAAQSPRPASVTPILAGTRGLLSSTSAHNLRLQFGTSHDYAEFVRQIAAAADAGDPTAEYLSARALKYCHENAHWGVQHPGGAVRTRNELEVRVGNYPLTLQQEILESYDRCRGYLPEGGQAEDTSAWSRWLDKASADGYPPAQSLQAEVARAAEVMRDAANLTDATSGIIPPPLGPARELAIGASLSADPESIIEMMNWVDGTTRSGDDYWALASAWGLLACQRGYDGCGPTSSWLRSICSWDAQCANDGSVIDTLRRQFGGRFDQVQSLADSIGVAIDGKDRSAVEGYL